MADPPARVSVGNHGGTLTEAGRALSAQAELVPPAIVARLGMEIAELEELHGP